ncbi:hypothetical protein MPQ_1413 [Methylovorus sp. MP688]|nr:hypothetical protein MPQ_1413 [Methylovorus sp. MP688]
MGELFIVCLPCIVAGGLANSPYSNSRLAPTGPGGIRH